jgi:hypothetical protein
MKCGAFNLPESIWTIKNVKKLSFEFFIAHYDIMNVGINFYTATIQY